MALLYTTPTCNMKHASYIILLYPDERRPTPVHSNDTLVDTPFQLISWFFHVNQGVLCCEHVEQASSRGVLEGGGGGGGGGDNMQAC